MDCDAVELLLVEAEGALPGPALAHLAGCPRCRDFQRDLSRTLALATLPPPEAREQLALAGLGPGVVLAHRTRERRRAVLGQALRLAMAAGLGAVVASLALRGPERIITRDVPVVVPEEAVALEWPRVDAPNLLDDDVLDEVSWPSLNEGDAP